MDFAGFNWTLILVGVLVLAVAIFWAMRRNRTPPSRVEDSEEATRRVYEEEDRAHRGESDDVP